MTLTLTVIADIRIAIVKKTTKLNFRVIKVKKLAVVIIAIEKIKLLVVYQPLKLTIYINLI